MHKKIEFDKNEYKLIINKHEEQSVQIYNLHNKTAPTLVNFNVNANNLVNSPCPYFERCGNCDMLNINYQTQLELKQQFIQNMFDKFQVNVQDIVGLYYPYKFRNKVHLSFAKNKGKTVIGFIKNGTSDVTDIPHCLMHESWFKVLYKELQEYVNHSKIIPYNKETQMGEIRYAVARCLNGNLMLTLVTTKNVYNGLSQLYNALKKQFKNVCLYININTTKTSAVLSDNFIHKFGDKTIKGTMCGVDFELSPKSFLQVNTQIATKIYNKVSQILQLKNGNNIIDCFSGIGISSLIFAKAGANVESIELVENACKDAKNLAKNNNLSEKIHVNCGDCNILLSQIAQKQPNSVMFADPPRMGLGEQFINTVLSSNINKIVYLSCNIITLVSDLNKLTKKYKITSVIPYDMFPHTKHIETLVTLERI